MSAFPIKIRMNPQTLEILAQCEEPRREDTPEEEAPILTWDVCQRHRSVLRIDNAEEADDVYFSVCSGTFELYRYRMACKIADILRPHAKPETVKRWRRPDPPEFPNR